MLLVVVASPEDEIRLNNGFLEQLIMYYNATENIYLKLLRTKKREKCPIVVSSFFFGEIKNFRIFRIVIFVEKYGHEDSEQDFLYKKLTFSKHFLATF